MYKKHRILWCMLFLFAQQIHGMELVTSIKQKMIYACAISFLAFFDLWDGIPQQHTRIISTEEDVLYNGEVGDNYCINLADRIISTIVFRGKGGVWLSDAYSVQESNDAKRPDTCHVRQERQCLKILKSGKIHVSYGNGRLIIQCTSGQEAMKVALGVWIDKLARIEVSGKLKVTECFGKRSPFVNEEILLPRMDIVVGGQSCYERTDGLREINERVVHLIRCFKVFGDACVDYYDEKQTFVECYVQDKAQARLGSEALYVLARDNAQVRIYGLCSDSGHSFSINMTDSSTLSTSAYACLYEKFTTESVSKDVKKITHIPNEQHICVTDQAQWKDQWSFDCVHHH